MRLPALLLLPLALHAAPIHFDREIKPLLSARCLPCHTVANLSATPAQVLAMVSGDAPKMPKSGPRLTSAEVDLLRRWADESTLWWSQKPLTQPPPPASGHPIDAFIRAQLKSRGLAPSPRADALTLTRRLTYDLHGLPPAPTNKTYSEQIDDLLSSPRYGERWARHWLDVVHYGDSHGYDKDKPRPNAWPYRDYVIAALNSDKPYAQFIEEQIAGDLTGQAIAATGFLAAGPWDFVGHQELREGTADKDLTRLLDRDDIVTTVVSTFNSQTVHCARCHNHKFDPIKQSDYNALQSVFAGVDRADRSLLPNHPLLEQKRKILLQLQPLLDKADNTSTPELDALEYRSKDSTLPPADRKSASESRAKLLAELLGPAHATAVAALQSELQKIQIPPTPQVYAVSNIFDRVGTFRPALTPRPMPEPPGAVGLRFPSGPDPREALAHHISSPANAFTWRSIVNRVWHYHFGAGLVDTPNDFGRMGGQPSHPELLDYLAVWFRDEAKGSLKSLHRLILTSETYQQSSAHRPDAALVDADNRLLWRMNRTRLDAESVRDSLLSFSGKLDLTLGGPPVRLFNFKDDHSPVYDYKNAPESYRRSIYRFIVRSVPDPFMDRLDCADPAILTPKRNVTLTAIQALTLLNNPFVQKMATETATRVKSIDEAYRLILQRDPTKAERDLLSQHDLPTAVRLLFNTNEFNFVD